MFFLELLLCLIETHNYIFDAEGRMKYLGIYLPKEIKLWKILKQMGIPDHLTCLLRNLYAGQEATLELDMEQQTGSK